MPPMEIPAAAILTSALASFLIAGALVLAARRYSVLAMDVPGAVQKFHSRPTPRIGGIGIYLALVAASRLVPDPDTGRILSTILFAGIPALLMGLLEDITRSVGVSMRLAATIASGMLACWIGDITVTHLDIPFVDGLLHAAPVALLFTAIAVGGVANAFNIIDGFHGLASGTATLCLLALALIAALVGDTSLALTAIVVAAAVVGFWVVNFPWGRLFLGDGGAYFAGFALAWLAVLLPMRNAEVSPWASLLLCAYPIIEVLYSIVRRRHQSKSPGAPDRRHLHSLVATHVVQRRLPRLDPTLQNSAVSVIMWCCAAVPAAVAVLFHDRAGVLAFSALSCVAAYHFIYRRVART